MHMIKSNLRYTRGITPKRVTSGGAHLRGAAPGLHSSEQTSQRWRAVASHCADLWRAVASHCADLERAVASRADLERAVRICEPCGFWSEPLSDLERAVPIWSEPLGTVASRCEPLCRFGATALCRFGATVASHCADLTGPGIEPQTSRTESVRLATELTAGGCI